MNPNPDRQRIRDELRAAMSDPARVCEALGLTEGAKRQAQGLSVRCPLHVEQHPSCSVTRAPGGGLRVRCFAGCDFGGANEGGDELGLVAAVERLDPRRDFVRVLDKACSMFGVDTRPNAPSRPVLASVPPTKPLVDLTPLWGSLPVLDASGVAYLTGRGLQGAADLCRTLPDAGEHAHLARAGYVLGMALRDGAGRVVGIQFRHLTATHDDRFRIVGSAAGVFGDPSTIAGARNVVIAEGMTDTLAAVLSCRAGKVTTAIGVPGVKSTAGLDGMPLTGKIVLVAMDADGPGDEAAGKIADKMRGMGATPIRARPTDGADLATTPDLAGFFKRTLSESLGFKGPRARLAGERDQRLAMRDRVIPFGVNFYDRALGGIAPTDVLLIGGESGKGKTELMRIIAQHNAAAGRRVHQFVLEGDKAEIERRMKYPLLVKRVLDEVGGARHYPRLNYLDWSYGRIDDITGRHESAVDEEIATTYAGLQTHYPEDDFTIDHFDRAVRRIAGDTDLVTLDHFHFLDFGDRELQGAKAAIKRIRRLNQDTGIPIVVLAHLRKGDKARPRMIPTLDDFHGSSDVVKIATKVITLAPASDRPSKDPLMWNTYLANPKCRVEGARARYAACVAFDARTRTYADAFTLGTVNPSGDKFEEVPADKVPPWARDKGSFLDEARKQWQDREPGSDG